MLLKVTYRGFKPLLHCLGCMLRRIVLMEGKPSAQSECSGPDFLSFWLKVSLYFVAFTYTLKTPPTSWCYHHHASLLGWYCAEDAPDLMLGIEVYQIRILFLSVSVSVGLDAFLVQISSRLSCHALSRNFLLANLPIVLRLLELQCWLSLSIWKFLHTWSLELSQSEHHVPHLYY